MGLLIILKIITIIEVIIKKLQQKAGTDTRTWTRAQATIYARTRN